MVGKSCSETGAQERHRCYHLLTCLCARQCIRHPPSHSTFHRLYPLLIDYEVKDLNSFFPKSHSKAIELGWKTMVHLTAGYTPPHPALSVYNWFCSISLTQLLSKLCNKMKISTLCTSVIIWYLRRSSRFFSRLQTCFLIAMWSCYDKRKQVTCSLLHYGISSSLPPLPSFLPSSSLSLFRKLFSLLEQFI